MRFFEASYSHALVNVSSSKAQSVFAFVLNASRNPSTPSLVDLLEVMLQKQPGFS